MVVYVMNKNGQPLMPTTRFGKVRRLLNKNLAKVIKRCPFTIQLLYEATDFVQPITLGVDAGSKTVGTSATTEDRELYASEVELRNDIVGNLSSRREYRRGRRYRKTRYRKARFKNRKASKPSCWLSPSTRNKIDTHLTVIDKITKILPISEIRVEVASFDIQKIKNPEIKGTEYQEGVQLDFWNVREYVLWRDNHTCKCCKGKSKDNRLNVHHIESRKTGGNAPNNLVTLCETCHNNYHQGKTKLPKTIKRGISFKDAAFMSTMRWAFYNKVKEIYESKNIPVYLTYGYITKNTRIKNNLPKEHCVDAHCISGHPNAMLLDNYYFERKVRCHNRQIHKLTINKGGYRKRNQADYEVYGFRLFDKVLFKNVECFIFGRRTTGRMDVRKLNGEHINASAGYKNLKLLERSKHILIERRKRSFLSNASGGVSTS